MAIITGLPIPLAVQSSLVVMGVSSLTSASNLALLSSSLPWLVALCGECQQCPFHCSYNDEPNVWASIDGILTIHAPQTFINLSRTEAFHSKKINHHSLPSTYDHNICQFAPLLCWKHVTDSSTDDPDGAVQRCYPVGKATKSTRRHIWKEKQKEALISYRPPYMITDSHVCS
jgi:hypothetical protein